MINRVVLVGRITRDPELRKTANDYSVVNFTIALDNYAGRGQEPTTSFIPCVVWGTIAENTAKYVRKGQLLGIDGKLQQRSYERRDGTRASVVEVICDSVQFLEPRRGGGGQDTYTPDYQDDSQNLETVDILDNDLPF